MTSSNTPMQAGLVRNASIRAPMQEKGQEQDQQLKTTLSYLCYDVLLIICDHLDNIRSQNETPIKHFSSANRHLRNLLSPCLFKILHINRPIKLLQYSPPPAFHPQTLKIDMFGSMWWWCSGEYVNGNDALEIFRTVKRLNVRYLEVRMMRRSIDIFEMAFRKSKNRVDEDANKDSGDEEGIENDVFILDNVEKLVVTNSAAFLANHCPGLKTLDIQDGDDGTVESYVELNERLAPLHHHLPASTNNIGLSPHLTSLSVPAIWSLAELVFLVATFPSLQHLSLLRETNRYHAPLPTIISLLSTGLPALQTLRLAKLSDLDLWFRPVLKMVIQRCQVFSQRKRLWLENEAQRVKTENEMAREVFKGLKGLRELWIGEGRVARRGAGDSEADRWMWERKLEMIDREGVGTREEEYREERNEVIVRWEIGM